MPKRRVWIVGLCCSVAVAAFVGLRTPSLWTVTLYNVTLSDGTPRRALLGTLLTPLWSATGHRFAGYESVAFLVLAAIVVVVVVSAVRARWTAQRLLVVVWLLAPTGGYLFHEVGYLDQVNFLLLLASLWLWPRTRPLVAVLPVAASMFVHESAILTTLPVLYWYVWVRSPHRRQLLALLLPSVIGLISVLLPPLTHVQGALLSARLSHTLAFGFRQDAVDLLTRTQGDSWQLYSQVDGLGVVAPFAAAIAVVWVGLMFMTAPEDQRTRRVLLGALLASEAPFGLILGGWDFSRWVFLGLSSFAIVMFLWLADTDREPRPVVVAGIIVPFALLLVLPLHYFDGVAPRGIGSFAAMEQPSPGVSLAAGPLDELDRWRFNDRAP